MTSEAKPIRACDTRRAAKRALLRRRSAFKITKGMAKAALLLRVGVPPETETPADDV